MAQPIIANGVPVSMTNGSDVKNSAFSVIDPKTFAENFPVVHDQALLGGLPFTATLVTVIYLVKGRPVVLLGATVTDSDGYSGVLTPAHAASAKFDFG